MEDYLGIEYQYDKKVIDGKKFIFVKIDANEFKDNIRRHILIEIFKEVFVNVPIVLAVAEDHQRPLQFSTDYELTVRFIKKLSRIKRINWKPIVI